MFWLKKGLMQRMIRRSRSGPTLPLSEAERKHKDPHQPLFNDSSYFNGLGEDGSFFVVRQSFRTTRGNEYWLKLHFPDAGTYELKNFTGVEGEGFQQGALLFECVAPGKTWNISFEGELVQGSENYPARLNLTFEASHPLIDFKDGANQEAVAATIAKEPWNREFFHKLREIKKTHLEQPGTLTGEITIQGKTRAVQWSSLRDHSWGVRNWGKWKRHLWMGAVLDNGEALNFSSISYDFLGQLSAGYMTSQGKTYHLVQAPEFSSFAQNPLVPHQHQIKLVYDNNQTVQLEWEIYNNFLFTMDREYEIFEGMARYKINGIPGRGVAEFGLNPTFYDIPFL